MRGSHRRYSAQWWDDRIDAFAHVQQLLAGGERVSPKHARMLLETYPRTRLVNGYGPTENTTFTLCHTVTLRDTASANGIPIGKPIRGTTVRIVPTDTQGEGAATTHLAAASEGELLAAGEGVALGYLNDVALTERKFSARRWHTMVSHRRRRSRARRWCDRIHGPRGSSGEIAGESY